MEKLEENVINQISSDLPPDQEKDENKMSIEGNIQWKLLVNLETKETQILCNNSVSNEAAMLCLAHQLIDNIISSEKSKGVKDKNMTRLRITQFELQKLFGRCFDYILNNKDSELTKKE